MTKRTKGKKPRVKNRAVFDLERTALDLYHWYYDDGTVDGPKVFNNASLWFPEGIADKKLENMLLGSVQTQSLFWHYLVIAYCRDEQGHEYLKPGYAKSTTRLVMLDDGTDSIKQDAVKMMEEDLNLDHVYAYGVIISPRSQHNHDIMLLAEFQKPNLRLTQSDINYIRSVINP